MRLHELLAEHKKHRRAKRHNIKPKGPTAHEEQKQTQKEKDVKESRGHKILANKLKDIERAKKFASGELQIPTPQQRKNYDDARDTVKKKTEALDLRGLQKQFDIGTYTYYTWEDDDGDVRKLYHVVKSDDGKEFDVDWTPYSKMTPQDLKIWIKLGMPDRKSIMSIGPLRHEDLVKYAQAHGIANLDPELAGAK